MKKHLSFNKIYVVESLSSTETKTGENLYNDLLRWKAEQPDKPESELIKVSNRKEFFDCIENIKKEFNSDGKLPFIHLEMHGSTSKNGLILNSGQLITWLELTNRFREINILINHNLFVSLATCFGAYIYSEIKPTDKAPFWGFVAPWGEVESGDVEVSFNSFFDTLLTTFNFNDAVKNLNETNNLPYRYHFYNAEVVFDKAFQKYEDENYNPDNFQKRVLNLIYKALEDYNVRTKLTIPQIRQYIENKLINKKEEYKEQMRRTFLMNEEE